jgi:chromosome segregation ATPase
MKKLMILPVSLALLAGGCATSKDPHEGGFIGGVQGLSNGGYEQRLKEREERLQRLRDEQQALDKESSDLKNRQSSLQKKLASDKRKLKKLSADTSKLKKQLARMKKSDAETRQKIADLQHRLGGLQQNISNTTSSLDALEGNVGNDKDIERKRARLEAQRRDLEKEYQLLLDLTLQL